MTDLRPLIMVNDVPLTECETDVEHDGATFRGFDPERRRVTVWLHPDMTTTCPHCGVDDDDSASAIERAAYADPESGDRLPALQNAAIPEPAPVFVFPAAKKLLPWEKPA